MRPLSRLIAAAHTARGPVPNWARQVRDSLGSAYGRARTVLARGRSGGDPVHCHRCLLHTGVPGTWIGRDGLCQECREHERRFSPEVAAQAAEAFRTLPRGAADHDLVVGISGGKDSAAALALAVWELELKPLAFIIKHEFLDDEAESRARAVCDRLGVPLEVHEVSLAADVRRALASPSLSPWPCLVCCAAQARTALALCDRLGVRRVGIGGRYFWDDRYTAVSPATYVYRYFAVPRRPRVQVANLIPACRADEHRQLELRDRLGYLAPAIPGNTTNCLLHPVFETLHRERYGYAWEAERLISRELRSGAISRATAERLARDEPVPSELFEDVHRRAGLRWR